jgi:hypothetical protein
MQTMADRGRCRKGAVRKRTQLRAKVMGETTWTKRNKKTGRFMDQKKAGEEKIQRRPPREKVGVMRRETS